MVVWLGATPWKRGSCPLVGVLVKRTPGSRVEPKPQRPICVNYAMGFSVTCSVSCGFVTLISIVVVDSCMAPAVVQNERIRILMFINAMARHAIRGYTREIRNHSCSEGRVGVFGLVA
jgi:hypothetical protein